MASMPSNKDFVWTREFYDAFLDTSIYEQTLNPPYFKEWTIRELIKIPNKWSLVTGKYPSFPKERPDNAAMVNHYTVNVAANSSPPLPLM